MDRKHLWTSAQTKTYQSFGTRGTRIAADDLIPPEKTCPQFLSLEGYSPSSSSSPSLSSSTTTTSTSTWSVLIAQPFIRVFSWTNGGCWTARLKADPGGRFLGQSATGKMYEIREARMAPRLLGFHVNIDIYTYLCMYSIWYCLSGWTSQCLELWLIFVHWDDLNLRCRTKFLKLSWNYQQKKTKINGWKMTCPKLGKPSFEGWTVIFRVYNPSDGWLEYLTWTEICPETNEFWGSLWDSLPHNVALCFQTTQWFGWIFCFWCSKWNHVLLSERKPCQFIGMQMWYVAGRLLLMDKCPAKLIRREIVVEPFFFRQQCHFQAQRKVIIDHSMGNRVCSFGGESYTWSLIIIPTYTNYILVIYN